MKKLLFLFFITTITTIKPDGAVANVGDITAHEGNILQVAQKLCPNACRTVRGNITGCQLDWLPQTYNCNNQRPVANKPGEITCYLSCNCYD